MCIFNIFQKNLNHLNVRTMCLCTCYAIAQESTACRTLHRLILIASLLELLILQLRLLFWVFLDSFFKDIYEYAFNKSVSVFIHTYTSMYSYAAVLIVVFPCTYIVHGNIKEIFLFSWNSHGWLFHNWPNVFKSTFFVWR